MHRHLGSHYLDEEPEFYGHKSRREPQGHRSGFGHEAGFTDFFEDMSIGFRNPSIRTSRHGFQGKSHFMDNMSSDYPSMQSGHHGKRRGSNYMDGVGSYYHSTHGGNHGKQSSHHQLDGMGSIHRPSDNHHHSHSHHHGQRKPHHYTHDTDTLHSKPHHKPTSGKKALGELLFKQALQPFNKDTGTPYPCSQTDIDFHRKNVFPKPNKGPFVKVREATKELMWHNDPERKTPASEKAAIQNLLSFDPNTQEGLTLGPDLAIKAFKDLDLVFFGGALQNHVTVNWCSDVECMIKGSLEEVWGVCKSSSQGWQCRIELNARMIFREGWTRRTPHPFESMIGTLLHEMCHAYERVRSPYDIEPGEGHGKFFGTRIAVVHKRALRILGLWAIEDGEEHRQHHFFPGCGEGWRSKPDDEKYRGKNDDYYDKSGKRSDGLKVGGAKKNGINSKASSTKTKQKRNPKGSDCVIM